MRRSSVRFRSPAPDWGGSATTASIPHDPLEGLMVSPSGVRGIVGDRFTPERVLRAPAAHASLLGPGPIVVGRDSRPSGAWVMRAVIAALLAAGRDVMEIGIAPTPAILCGIQHPRAAGGIAIPAGHNPAPWNALKLFGPGGTFLAPAAAETVFLRVREGGFRWSRHDGVGSIRADDDAIRRHRDAILALPGLGVDVIRKRRFKVAVDCVNGAGSIATPALLRELGCEVTEIHCVPDGLFPRVPEPLPENLGDLGEAATRSGAAVGFANDPHADRLAPVHHEWHPL